ncbi:MAG: hypothetical protein HY905_24870 [Deltaproteobacteria bacterium]|nr:hypothetical protein [Deltaproteobacteria bacterium]
MAPRESAWNYACRPEKVRTFRSSNSDLDDIPAVFRDKVNFVLDFRQDPPGARRCTIAAPQWIRDCPATYPECRPDGSGPEYCDSVCWVVSDEGPVDGPSVPILGNTSICLTAATMPWLPGSPPANVPGDGDDPWDPFLYVGQFYANTARPLESAGASIVYGPEGFPCEFYPASSGCVPYGFVGMDACWPFRIFASLDIPTSTAGRRFSILTPASISSSLQGLGGLPAMVCNPTWVEQWMKAGDRAGPLGAGIPDGWVDAHHDSVYWALTGSDPAPDGWWWDRDADDSFSACRDYLDGDDEQPPGSLETCASGDFDYWNRATGEYHPDGFEYISRADVQSWGGEKDKPLTWFNCPMSQFGLQGFDDFTVWTLLFDVTHKGDHDKIWFAPGNRSAFCGDPSSGDAVPMLPDAPTAGVSRMTARWVDVGGRPALRLSVRLGAEMGVFARFLWAKMMVDVTAVNIDITIQPRLCDGLRESDFCTHKDKDGSCDRTLSPVGAGLCGFEMNLGQRLPDAWPGTTRGSGMLGRGGATDGEQDWNGPLDELPEPLVLANNNVLYHLDVSASFERKYTPLVCWDPLSAIFCAGIYGYAESELEKAEKKQAGTMFNTLARALFYGMGDRKMGCTCAGDCSDCELRCVECSVESGFATAAHYLRRWFWQPAIDQLPHGGDGLDVSRAPDPNAVRFTDIRWASSAHDTAEFAFTWDKDLDGYVEQDDNCPSVPNPDQLDTDHDCTGSACEGDLDGDRCCEGGCDTDAPGMTGCICGGPEPDPECVTDGYGRTCHDDYPWWYSWNHDDDRVPDDCDRNDDNDVFPDDTDNCDFTPTTYNWDYDADGIGNACDDSDDRDHCWDATECNIADYVPDDWTQPCGEAACVNGQCRVGTEAFPYDHDPPLCGCDSYDEHHTHCLRSTCEALGQTCVYHPASATGITDDLAFWCEPMITTEPFACMLLSGGPPGGPLSEGGVEDVFEAFHLWPYGPSHMPPYVTTLIPCLPEAGDDCCRTCTEPIIRVVGQENATLAEIRPMLALDRPLDDFTGMDVTVVPDVNANNSNDIAVSLPYAVDENKGVVGTIVTFDGQSGEILRVRERDGAFGNLMARAGEGMAARFRPFMTIFTDSMAVGSIEVSPEQPAGISLMNRWGIEVAFVADAPNVKGKSLTRMTGAWVSGEQLAVVYSPTCDFVSNKGCLTGYDQYGAVKWSAAGWQSGNEFGASFDSDGTYVAVGIPGYDTGTGGMVQVLRPGSNWSRNITQRGRVRDLGRHVAIAEATSGPRILASALVNDLPVVLEFALNGRLRATYPTPAGWKIVDVVSPSFDDGTTLDLFAIVYITPEGRVFHQMLHADGSNSGR